MFTYSTQEREGAESQRQVFAEWVFHEDKGGGHGTKMFSVRPEVSAVLLATLKTAL
ncbi:MAG: hypothetical protein GWP91_22795 [Rhodobacterales bacterium]|nr:hypothetical protein [Rhodobacterales bacterium]